MNRTHITMLRTIALALALLFASQNASYAATTANVNGTVTINSGGLDISSNGTNIAFGAVTLNGVDQTVTASSAPTFTVYDGTGTGNGWNITFSATDFTDGGTGLIAASNFTFNATGGSINVSGTGGQAVDATNGPKETAGGALSLDSSRKVVTTLAGYGKGRYSYAPSSGNFSLTVPATTIRGTGSLTSTLTATISSGP